LLSLGKPGRDGLIPLHTDGRNLGFNIDSILTTRFVGPPRPRARRCMGGKQSCDGTTVLQAGLRWGRNDWPPD